MLKKLIGGRLNRKKYIICYLATIVTCVFLMFAVSAIMLATGQASEIEQGGNVYLSGLVIGLLANLVTICLGIRRLHDLGKGGKWVLVVIIPAVFSFAVYFVENQLLTNFASALDIAVIMALAVMKGNDGANEFGPAN